jgi:hypothetical protein
MPVREGRAGASAPIRPGIEEESAHQHVYDEGIFDERWLDRLERWEVRQGVFTVSPGIKTGAFGQIAAMVSAEGLAILGHER